VGDLRQVTGAKEAEPNFRMTDNLPLAYLRSTLLASNPVLRNWQLVAAQHLANGFRHDTHVAATRWRSASNSAEAFFAAPLNANHTNSSRTHVAIIGQTLVKYR
jgi:hypothetical protein